MGDSRKRSLRVHFDRRLKLGFHGTKITSDGGSLVHRELDEALGLMAMAKVAVPGDLFVAIVRKIDRLRVCSGSVSVKIALKNTHLTKNGG